MPHYFIRYTVRKAVRRPLRHIKMRRACNKAALLARQRPSRAYHATTAQDSDSIRSKAAHDQASSQIHNQMYCFT